MNTITRREIAHRISALGLSVLTTLSILGSVNLLAVEPAPDSLLAQRHTPVAIAAAPAAASARS
ncbi:MAG: hypothetical protein C0505_10690 [Leptothrix sp. (in: Bacteria)]|nr:hypothetical protein [Leptothrix sp. (in: b-proteobacteria)]